MKGKLKSKARGESDAAVINRLAKQNKSLRAKVAILSPICDAHRRRGSWTPEDLASQHAYELKMERMDPERVATWFLGASTQDKIFVLSRVAKTFLDAAAAEAAGQHADALHQRLDKLLARGEMVGKSGKARQARKAARSE